MASRALDAVAPGGSETAQPRAIPVDGALGVQVGDTPDGGVQLRVPYPVVPADNAETDLGVGSTVAICVLADAACGIAMARNQRIEISGPTIELRIDHARPPSAGASWIIARARLQHLTGGAGLLTAQLSDDTGQSVALATGHFLVLPPRAEPERLPVGDLDGRYTASALVDILGGPDIGAAAAPEEWSVPSVPALANPRNQMHGGVVMAIGQLAQRRMQAAALEEPRTLQPLSVTAEYLRPVAIDGAPLRCRTEYVRRGRRFRGLRTELTGSDQRVCAVVTGLWAVRP